MVTDLKNIARIANYRANYTPNDDLHLYNGIYISNSLDVANLEAYLTRDMEKHHTALEVIVIDYDVSEIHS